MPGMKSPLRAVDPEERAEPEAPTTISEAAESGSARDVWVSMRRALALKLDNDEVSSNAIATAYKELRELDRLIRIADAELEAEGEKRDGERKRRTFNPAAV